MLEKYSKIGKRVGTCGRTRRAFGCDLKFVPPRCYVVGNANFGKEICPYLCGDALGRDVSSSSPGGGRDC